MKKNLSKKLDQISPSMTLAISSKARQMKENGIDVISFGAGEPDFDTPLFIRNAANEAMEKGYTRYTEVAGIMELRQAICKKLKEENNIEYEPNEIIVSSGAKHALFTALQTLVSEGDEVLIPVPYWVSYSEMVKIAGGVPVFVYPKKENNFVLTKDEVAEKITDKTKAIMINNPSNPTGAVIPKETLTEIANLCVENGIYIISDEIYERLVYDDISYTSIASISEDVKDITLTVNGFSKAYAMTGWRLGYTAANKEIVSAMTKIQGQCVSHPSSITQYAGMKALLGDQSCIEEMKIEYVKRRNYMVSIFDKIKDISYIKPQGAFYVFVDVSKYYGKKYEGKELTDSISFADMLLTNKKIATIPGVGFGEDDYIRFSYATSMENIVEGLKRFEEFISEIK